MICVWWIKIRNSSVSAACATTSAASRRRVFAVEIAVASEPCCAIQASHNAGNEEPWDKRNGTQRTAGQPPEPTGRAAVEQQDNAEKGAGEDKAGQMHLPEQRPRESP